MGSGGDARLGFPFGTRHYNRSIAIHFDGEFMGKGDVRSRRGKIFNHSYGKKRRHRPKQAKKRPGAGS
jgi:ribosomal small subunit protein bTHX